MDNLNVITLSPYKIIIHYVLKVNNRTTRMLWLLTYMLSVCLFSISWSIHHWKNPSGNCFYHQADSKETTQQSSGKSNKSFQGEKDQIHQVAEIKGLVLTADKTQWSFYIPYVQYYSTLARIGSCGGEPFKPFNTNRLTDSKHLHYLPPA